MAERKVRYYQSFDTDFYDNSNDHRLPDGYRWVRKDLFSRVLSAAVYTLALIFSSIYCRFFLYVKIKGKSKLRGIKNTGFFFYGNHTQPVGDVFIPALICFPKRIYTIVSPANFALPVIGKILPYLGALPISESLSGMKRFNEAVKYRIKNGHPVVIYPEAHVWEYYTGIRPYPETSFKMPIKLNVPVFCFTVTYQKRRFGKKPAITVYVDGPFDSAGTNAKDLRDSVFSAMKEQSLKSNYSYIEYRKEQE